jgi:hypothetical protein
MNRQRIEHQGPLGIHLDALQPSGRSSSGSIEMVARLQTPSTTTAAASTPHHDSRTWREQILGQRHWCIGQWHPSTGIQGLQDVVRINHPAAAQTSSGL